MMPTQKYTVTVVEDNKMNLQLFVDLLELNDIRVRPIINGALAFDDITNNVPDLIVMDIQLKEMSGVDIVKQVRCTPHLEHIPIVAVTAFASQHDEERLLSAGCSAYLAKPISIDQFIGVINKFLSHKNTLPDLGNT